MLIIEKSNQLNQVAKLLKLIFFGLGTVYHMLKVFLFLLKCI